MTGTLDSVSDCEHCENLGWRNLVLPCRSGQLSHLGLLPFVVGLMPPAPFHLPSPLSCQYLFSPSCFSVRLPCQQSATFQPETLCPFFLVFSVHIHDPHVSTAIHSPNHNTSSRRRRRLLLSASSIYTLSFPTLGAPPRFLLRVLKLL